LRVIERGIPLPVGSLMNKRSLVGLSNLLDFISVCTRNPAAANQIFLVSDGEDLSTPELLRRVGHAMGRPARIFPFPETLLRAAARMVGRSEAVQRLADSLQVDISKNRELLGWEPGTAVDEELRRTTAALRRD
jgi:nucleoside-diphosphate-sugar epimerase